MPKKSVREMKKWELRHYSLEAKMFRSVIQMAIIIGIFALLIGLGLYSWSLANQYIGEAFGLSRSTAAVMEEVIDAGDLTEEVMSVYRSLSDEERGTIRTEEYRARFSGVEKREDYQTVMGILKVFRDSGDVNDVYLGFYDRETQALVYICDPDASEETGCFPGDYDAVSGKEIEKFWNWDGTGKLYQIAKTERYGLLCTSGVPLRGSDGEIDCFVLADVTLGDVVRGIRLFLLQYSITLMIVVNLTGIILSRRMKKKLVDPINEIAEAAENYVNDRIAGNTETNRFSDLHINSGDEVENLSLVMADMEQGLADYENYLMSVTAEKERISTELSLATRIQANMLPSIYPAFPERPEFDIYASMDPAKEVGGDFYDFFLVDEDHLGMVMADVSGKGVPAALFMMATKIILANHAIMGKSPAEVLKFTNDAICANNREEMFITVWIGILEISTGKVTAANAGHEYPVLRKADGSFELIKDRHGIVIGAMEGAAYREYELQMEPGAKLFVYTDGVPEATNTAGELFGTERMLDALNSDPDASPEDILRNIRRAVDEFTGDAEQFDDLTMLCMEYCGAIHGE